MLIFPNDDKFMGCYNDGMPNGILAYLLEQKRGPIQYVLNILNYSIFGYRNEFLIRLLYLVFGNILHVLPMCS